MLWAGGGDSDFFCILFEKPFTVNVAVLMEQFWGRTCS